MSVNVVGWPRNHSYLEIMGVGVIGCPRNYNYLETMSVAVVCRGEVTATHNPCLPVRIRVGIDARTNLLEYATG